MVKLSLREMIEVRALEFDIDPDLIESFCMVESSGNPKATRYEANFFERYIKPMKLIDQVDAANRATSWGLMQLMGQVAREKGFKGDFKELLDPGVSLFWSLKHLKRFITKYAPNLDDAIAAYNAGSPRKKENGEYVNQVYVDRIHKFLNQIKGVA